MKKRFEKIIATVLTAAMAVSVGMPAFAAEEVANDEQQVVVQSSSFPDDKGGSVEFGVGLFNAWCKYTHVNNSHRAVLQTDNTYSYGAWEDAGYTPSYVEHARGNSQNVGSGEIR